MSPSCALRPPRIEQGEIPLSWLEGEGRQRKAQRREAETTVECRCECRVLTGAPFCRWVVGTNGEQAADHPADPKKGAPTRACAREGPQHVSFGGRPLPPL